MRIRLIFGCGYLGARVASRWRATGDQVWVVTRSPQRAKAFAEQGLLPIVADVMAPLALRDLPAVDSVLYAVGYDRAPAWSMREVYVNGLRNALEALPAATRRLLYIGSTGVYGQSDGSWVDEGSPCEPTRESGRVCLEAENLLRGDGLGQRAVILRLAGIYGPGRVPNQEALLAGEPIAAAQEGFLNLIHVDDAASVVLAVAEHAHPASLYLVSDGHPVPRGEYYAEAARLLGAPPPRFTSPPPGSPKADRATGNRRISNARLLADLGLSLKYASYREGLRAALAREAR